jgi:hypothetical protein
MLSVTAFGTNEEDVSIFGGLGKSRCLMLGSKDVYGVMDLHLGKERHISAQAL